MNSRYSPVSFNFKYRKSDCLVKFLFNSFAHIVYTQAFTHIDTRIPRNPRDNLRRSEINLRSEFPKAPWFDGCPIAHSKDNEILLKKWHQHDCCPHSYKSRMALSFFYSTCFSAWQRLI